MNEVEKEKLKLIANVIEEHPEEKDIAYKILKFNGFIRRDLEEDVIKDHKVLFHELQFYHENFFKFLKNVIEKTFINKEYFN